LRRGGREEREGWCDERKEGYDKSEGTQNG